MAKNLPSENVYSFMEQSILNQKNNVQAMEVMFNEMRNIREEAKQSRDVVTKVRDEVLVLAKQINDENRLLPSEIDELYEAVKLKSTSIVKNNTDLQGSELSKEVGKTRCFIWRKLNARYGISKYIHLPRKHFEDAMKFVKTFSVLDHV